MTADLETPTRPCRDAPSNPRATDQTASVIKGAMYYSGVWAAPDDPFRRSSRNRENLQAGVNLPTKTTLLHSFSVHRVSYVLMTGYIAVR